MTLLDVAMAAGGQSIDPIAGGGKTDEMKSGFMRSGPPAGRLILRGLCVHRTSTTAFWNAEILDQSDRLAYCIPQSGMQFYCQSNQINP
jgi:acyl-coenzyme A thioesterase PaaI-like protein